MMTAESKKSPSLRDLKKQKNRKLLLEATAKALHLHGIKGATIDMIQSYSGLGRGMINQHFESKNNLIWTVAEEMMNEYRANWVAALEKGGETPEEKLRAICKSEFNEAVLTQQKMAIWFTLRAETSSSSEYQKLIGDGDQELLLAVYELCKAICEKDKRADPNPEKIARIVSALFEGFLTEYHLEPEKFDRDEASTLCIDVISRYLPSV